ncbi:MAG: ATP-dependent DNA helicase RecG [Chloroflexota bacterium]|nr:ATP-dependent DNA helicase RecG [Chloroflexota bacterium]
MPTALETLAKILKLEREQGYRNSAVIGGMSAFADHWQRDAHTQARRPEHHILVDEMIDVLHAYDRIESTDERHARVGYMLERITGRTPAPERYLSRLSQYIEDTPSPPPAPPGVETTETPVNVEAEGEQPRRKKEKSRKKEERAAPDQRTEPPTRAEKSRGAPAPQANTSNRRAPGRPGANEDDESAFERPGGFNSESSRLDDYIDFSSKPSKRDLPLPPKLARPPRQPRAEIDEAASLDLLYGLHNSVERVKGVGPKQQELLEKVGIRSINDLLFTFPTRYDDYTQMNPIARLTAKTLATVIGTVRHTEVRVGRTGRRDFFMRVDDGSGTIGVSCFGQPYLQRTLPIGQQVVLRGQTSLFQNQIQLTNPEIQPLDLEDLQAARIVPVYRLTEGLNNRQLRRIIEKALDYWEDRIPDFIPEATLERLDLADLGWALRQMHFPAGWDHQQHAKHRLVFDQLLMLQLTIMANRRQWQAIPAIPLPIEDSLLDALIGTMFPYPLTGAQRRSIEAIRADIERPVPMNRLLQGDVGSGKTAVAAAALAVAAFAGGQAAIMAPTSILAEQHYHGIGAAFARIPDEMLFDADGNGRRPVVRLLTGSVRGAEREAILDGLRSGGVDVLIGTQAVIQSGVEFSNLTLTIIDEQHRFGVEQRGALRGKGTNPHLLVMTATPIPRTFALTVHADLDLSIIDEMPPGRTPVRTRVIDPTQRVKAYDLIEEQVALGRQAFIVYPLVEASDRIDAESAVEGFAALRQVFHRARVGLLHGRMSPDEKDSIMAAFRDHAFDIMVTTSVAEVGVDIPNASVMVIEGANRFGLSQLHQFRGRVGRGGFQSYCLLVCDSELPDAVARLMILEKTHDGFVLAQKDFELRGAGDLLGTQQSGKGSLELLEGIDITFVEEAQREARTVYQVDPDMTDREHRLLAARIRGLQDSRSDVS